MPFDAIEYINTPRWLTSRLGLERIRELLDRLGRPQDCLKFVHVAGTNGKGSTCAFTASILAEAGFKTQRFVCASAPRRWRRKAGSTPPSSS